MKTIKHTLVVSLLLVTLSTYAFRTVETAPNAISNELTPAFKKEHVLSIKDFTGNTIFSETITSNKAFNTSYDLSKLEDGLYTLELIKDYEIKSKKFYVADQEVTFLKNTETSVYKPVFRMEESRLLISQLALNKQSTLEIKIYFENELIHEEAVSGNAILNRVYNLKENVPGNYKVVMTANGRTYKRHFKI